MFVVLRVPFLVLFSFILSRCLFVFRLLLESPSLLLFSLPWWRIMLLCYYVSALCPPRAPCDPKERVFPLPLACGLLSFLRCWCWLICNCFFSSVPFSISTWTSFVFHPVFLRTMTTTTTAAAAAKTRRSNPFNVSHQFPWWLITAGKVPNIKNSSRRLPWRICTRV